MKGMAASSVMLPIVETETVVDLDTLAKKQSCTIDTLKSMVEPVNTSAVRLTHIESRQRMTADWWSFMNQVKMENLCKKMTVDWSNEREANVCVKVVHGWLDFSLEAKECLKYGMEFDFTDNLEQVKY